MAVKVCAKLVTEVCVCTKYFKRTTNAKSNDLHTMYEIQIHADRYPFYMYHNLNKITCLKKNITPTCPDWFAFTSMGPGLFVLRQYVAKFL